ncbi:unnamed protein product [Lymnaea stagnalis]|uniref:Major facilitator superfamily (MFS) profile domain-containing protein n=1 Tax=Lymnaea stagnalis TaxID=6523 RepID=A0AAV2I6Q5_LYMST
MTNEDSGAHPFISSTTYYLTKSGSYITDINPGGHRAGVGNGTPQLRLKLQAEDRRFANHLGLGHNNLVDETNFSHTKDRNFTKSPNGVYVNNNYGTKYEKIGHTRLQDKGESNRTKHDGNAGIEHKKEVVRFKFSQMSGRSKYTLLMLAIANFGAGCGFSLPAPFFPREATKKGASQTSIGLVFSCYQFVNFIACPMFGNYLTQIGAKFLYVSGILVAGICTILFGFLDQGPSGVIFIVMSFVVRMVEALGVSAFSTASFAIVSNEFPNHIGSVFATLETCIGIGLMIGPTIGGALYQFGGFGLPFWLIGVIICASGLAICTCLPKPQDNNLSRKGSVFSLLRSMMVWVTLLSILVGACGIAYLDPTLSDHLDQFGLSTLSVGLFFVIAPGLHAVMAPLWGYISDTKDIQSPLLITGNLVCAIGFLFVGPTPLLPFLPRELWTSTLGLILFGFTIGCSIVPTMKCLVIGARELGFPDGLNTFGLVSGLFNSTFCLGAFIGPTIGGALVDEIGFYNGSTIIAALYLFVMIVTSIFFGIRYLRRHHKNHNSILSDNHQHQDQESSLLHKSYRDTEKKPLLTENSHPQLSVTMESSYSSASYSQLHIYQK